MTHYYLTDALYQQLINGYNFGVNTPPFVTVDSKHYISKDNWDLWTTSKPNLDYVLNTFTLYSTIEDVTSNIFEELTESEYQTHKEDLSNNPAAFIDREWIKCEEVLKAMGAELHRQLEDGTINSLQGLQLQELFSKQEAMVFPQLGGISLSIPITEYLGQNRSLGAAKNRLVNTPVDTSIGFTQELKDHFISIIDKGLSALNA